MKKNLLLFLMYLSFSTYSQTYYSFAYLSVMSNNVRYETPIYLDNSGQIAYTQVKGERIWPLSEGLGVVRRNGKSGFIDVNGNIIIPLMYDDAKGFSEGKAAVKMNGKWGFINKKNEWIIEPTFKFSGFFTNNVGYYIDKTRNDSYRYFDTTGKFINDEHYLNAIPFNEDCAWVKSRKTRKWGCINTKGEFIIEPKYSEVKSFHNGKCWVSINKKWGCINKKNQYIVDMVYDMVAEDFYEFTWVKKGFNWGMLDSSGKIIIPFSSKAEPRYILNYEFAYKYPSFKTIYIGYGWGIVPTEKHYYFSIPSNVLMPFKTSQKWGYSDTTSKPIIDARYDEASNFIDGVAAVKLDKKWGLIDTTGKLICDYKFKNIMYLGYHLYCSEEKKDRFVVFDENGKLIINENFIRLSEFE